MWELLIHSTNEKNFLNIINDGYLKPIPYNTIRKYIPGVYMTLLFDTLKYTGKYWYHKRYIDKPDVIIFVFDTSILKTYPFKICPYSAHGSCIDDSLMDGEGNLSRKPNLSKIKNHIHHELQLNDDKKFQFTDTHEFIFTDNIPISLCKCIFAFKQNKYLKQFKEKYPDIDIIYITKSTDNISAFIENKINDK